jgi:hypothetical protein
MPLRALRELALARSIIVFTVVIVAAVVSIPAGVIASPAVVGVIDVFPSGRRSGRRRRHDNRAVLGSVVLCRSGSLVGAILASRTAGDLTPIGSCVRDHDRGHERWLHGAPELGHGPERRAGHRRGGRRGGDLCWSHMRNCGRRVCDEDEVKMRVLS